MESQFASQISVVALAVCGIVTFTARSSPALASERSIVYWSGTLQPAFSSNCQPESSAKLPVQLTSSPAPISSFVSEIARQVTVRVLSNGGSGSGVIIARQGQTYTVLTARHIVAFNQDNRFRILTSDRMTYVAQWQSSLELGNADLALLHFTSNKDYRIAVIGDSNTLAVGNLVYASGFPNWHQVERNRFQNTRLWGLRAFRLTEGRVGMLLPQSMLKGYQLGYTNQIERGMSGGPVLNQNGQLVGINGRLKYPPRGIRAFAFVDGTLPSRELFRQMEALSWAIPIATFQRGTRQLSGSI